MGRLSFSRTERADVAVLKRNLELWPVFREVVAGFSVLELETIKTPLNVRDIFRIFRYVIAKKASIGYASMAAQLRRSGVKVLLAVDQTAQVVEELGRLLPELRQVVVAHGSLRAETLPAHQLAARPHRVLGVWGRVDLDLYAKVSRAGVRCMPIGSLRNAGYQRLRQQLPKSVNAKILLISQFSGRETAGMEPETKREEMLYELEKMLRRYCTERSLPIMIALRPPVSAPNDSSHEYDERKYFQQVFAGVAIEFSDPRTPYSSYLASDASDVTVGVPTGAITESFARGNKVLMYCQSPDSGTNYRFPVEGAWMLTEPTYEQFAQRLDALRAMRREDCANSWRVEREYMVANAESDEPINLVRQLIERAIRGEAL